MVPGRCTRRHRSGPRARGTQPAARLTRSAACGILFDQGTPAPLREHLPGHDVQTAYERGWSTLRNGELLAKAEAEFDLLITTDRNLGSQQNMKRRKLAILVLPTTNWPRLRTVADAIAGFAATLRPGEIREFPLPRT